MIVEQQKYLHPLAVWCRFWAGGIIGPFFFTWDWSNSTGYWCSISRHDDIVISTEIRCYWYRLICSFNKTVQNPRQPVKHSNYSMKHFCSYTLLFPWSKLATLMVWLNTIIFLLMCLFEVTGLVSSSISPQPVSLARSSARCVIPLKFNEKIIIFKTVFSI